MTESQGIDMTHRAEIIEMAIASGFRVNDFPSGFEVLQVPGEWNFWQLTYAIEHLADQVEATERLACAKAALNAPSKTDKQEQRIACFNSIMARGEQ